MTELHTWISMNQYVYWYTDDSIYTDILLIAYLLLINIYTDEWNIMYVSYIHVYMNQLYIWTYYIHDNYTYEYIHESVYILMMNDVSFLKQ